MSSVRPELTLESLADKAESGGTADVVVVGAGVNGLATAQQLAASGVDVIVLEQYALGHNRGGSHGDARVFAYVHPEPEWAPLCVDALRLWRDLESEVGLSVLDDKGGLYATRRAAALTPSLAANGIKFEVLSAEQCAARFPVTVPAGTDVIYTPDSGTFDAPGALIALARSAKAHGAKILHGVSVTGIRTTAGGRVEIDTGAGTFHASAVVVAAGGWTSELVEPLGIDIPTRTLRGTVAYFPLEGSAYCPPLFEEGKPSVYSLVSPAHGLKIGESRVGSYLRPGETCEPDPGSVERLSQRVAERFPGAEPEVAFVETCQYTYTPDVTFRLEAHGPVITGVACEGRGFKFAPLTGATLASLALKRISTRK